MDFDDWELSVEELDKLERDALRQIAERNASSSSATTSSCLQSSRLQGDVNGSGVSYKRVSFHFYSCFRWYPFGIFQLCLICVKCVLCFVVRLLHYFVIVTVLFFLFRMVYYSFWSILLWSLQFRYLVFPFALICFSLSSEFMGSNLFYLCWRGKVCISSLDPTCGIITLGMFLELFHLRS